MGHRLTKTQVQTWINNNKDMIRKNKKSYKKGGPKYKKGGAKPDYLDFDKDGNTTEPMKSTYYGGGPVYNKKGMKVPGMRQMGGDTIGDTTMPPGPRRMKKPLTPVDPRSVRPKFEPMLTKEMEAAGYYADESGMIRAPKVGPKSQFDDPLFQPPTPEMEEQKKRGKN